MAALVGLLVAQRPRIRTVVLGHSRDAASRAAAEAFAEAWGEPEGRAGRGTRRTGRARTAVQCWPSSTGRSRRPRGCAPPGA
ncbi:hypothetical protein ACFQ0M_04270 [Kitasatospora aburaviensis]